MTPVALARPTARSRRHGSFSRCPRPPSRRNDPICGGLSPAETDGARVQICADRACTTILQTIDTNGTTAAPANDLPPCVAFWRALGKKGSSVGCTPSFTWEMFVGHRSAPVNTAWGSFPDPNGDGYADVILGCDPAKASLCVCPGEPNGVSTTAQPMASPLTQGQGSPVHVRGGDVNGDGFFDMVASFPDGPRAITEFRGVTSFRL